MELTIGMQAYCVKCKAKSEMVDPKPSKTSNGRDMMIGTCAKCGTKMSLFVAADKVKEKEKGGGGEEE